MHWLRSVLREIAGLFVEDGSFAATILVWVVVAIFVLQHSRHAAWWAGPVLAVGLGAILLESVLRFSRKGRR